MGRLCKKLAVIDGNSIINRAFYGVRPLNAPDGLPTGAIYGFINILQKNLDMICPDAVAVAFDLPGPTFRHKADSEYKANRHGMPDDLAVQLPFVREYCSLAGYTVIDKEGYEADDILGTLSKAACDGGSECVLVTGDRDSFQLISDCTSVNFAATGKTEVYDRERFKAEYAGLEPIKLREIKALMGDSSDNIKGVPGVGEKTALRLLTDYGSLDGVYENIEKEKGALKTKLENGKDSAYNSLFLATIVTNAPIDTDLDNYLIKPVDRDGMLAFTERLGFAKLREKLLSGFDGEIAKEKTEKEQIIPVPANAEEILAYPKDTLCGITFDGENKFYFCFSEEKILECECSDGLLKFFEDKERKTLMFCVKDMYKFLYSKGIEMQCKADDVSIAAYLDGEADTDEEKALLHYDCDYKFPDAYALLPLFELLKKNIIEKGMEKLYLETELPLTYVLAKTEIRGVCVDKEGLLKIGESLEAEIKEIENMIYALAGEEFNVNSPKQLGEVLFEKMGLRSRKKKTKSGYSTEAHELEKISGQHPIIELILRYRRLSKLKGTYADGLIKQINEKDGRIHTTFRQTLARTGRLSSAEPNLQNIPVRTPEGKVFRKFFTAPEGWVLLDADYSQIELRVMAHACGDEALIKAFNEGEDIHSVTAAKVFGVDLSEVTPEMRKQAKAVNFGIIYGIGEFSLADNLQIPMKAAKAYMESYFEKYPNIKKYTDRVVEEAKRDGYVTTLLSRRRYIPELASKNANLRKFGERAAMNAPIQGSAADIIKQAMVDTAARFESLNLKTRLVLQIHDELIAEAPIEEAAQAAKILTDCMENVIKLKVPLIAETNIGKTWYEAKGD